MGFLKNLFGKQQQQTLLNDTDKALPFLRDLAYMMGYNVSDTTTSFSPDVMSTATAIIDILRTPMPSSVIQSMLSELIWKVTKRSEVNDFIDRVLIMGGIRSQAEGRAEAYRLLYSDKNSKSQQKNTSPDSVKDKVEIEHLDRNNVTVINPNRSFRRK